MIKFLAGSCLSGLVRLGRIRDRFERTTCDLTLWMKPLLMQRPLLIARAGSFITSPYS